MLQGNNNLKDSEKFLKFVGENYEKLKYKYYNFCKEKGYNWDEDIFSDTILKVYDSIEKKGGLKDNSQYGMECYFFLSYRNNVKRDSMYARNVKRDKNITSDNVSLLYEDFVNKTSVSSESKLINDLFVDFSVLYILNKVEENFSKEHYYLFRIKYLSRLTYKQVAEKTKLKGTRAKIIEVKNWVKENVSFDEVKSEFYKFYSDIFT